MCLYKTLLDNIKVEPLGSIPHNGRLKYICHLGNLRKVAQISDCAKACTSDDKMLDLEIGYLISKKKQELIMDFYFQMYGVDTYREHFYKDRKAYYLSEDSFQEHKHASNTNSGSESD